MSEILFLPVPRMLTGVSVPSEQTTKEENENRHRKICLEQITPCRVTVSFLICLLRVIVFCPNQKDVENKGIKYG